MARQKITHIFNKNHIEIIKVENPESRYTYPKSAYLTSVQSGSPSYYVNAKNVHEYKGKKIQYDKKERCKYIEEKKVSKLGFYYYSRTYINDSVLAHRTDETNNERSRTILNIPVGDNIVYQLKYVTQFGENKIGLTEEGQRPWDIYPGDGDFGDNFLNSLVKDVEMLFNLFEENKIDQVMIGTGYSPRYYEIYPDKTTYKNIYDVKCTIYKELFGNIKGPRFQTDLEKILAHGFDPKYSFRKDKEKK